jgi:hypothetical protein
MMSSDWLPVIVIAVVCLCVCLVHTYNCGKNVGWMRGYAEGMKWQQLDVEETDDQKDVVK